MDALLNQVLAAHGGLDRWSQITGLFAKMSLGGPFWGAVGWPDVWSDQTVTIDPHREHITFTPFTAPGVTSVFDVDPERLEVHGADGQLVDKRSDPRPSFPVLGEGVTWDAIQVAYFTSCATWNYLTAPFLFTYPGVEAHEIEPWREGGQTWRRLAVTFPANLPNHNPDQVFYFDDDFMQRRMDYQPDVTGSLVAHYTYDHKTFDGFVFPTRRAIVLHDENGIADHSFVPITINVENVAVTR